MSSLDDDQHMRGNVRRLQWTAHVIRMNDERIPKKALQQTLYGKGVVGRPRKRWEDVVREKSWRESMESKSQGSIWAVTP
jgi:hypothetical protein